MTLNWQWNGDFPFYSCDFQVIWLIVGPYCAWFTRKLGTVKITHTFRDKNVAAFTHNFFFLSKCIEKCFFHSLSGSQERTTKIFWYHHPRYLKGFWSGSASQPADPALPLWNTKHLIPVDRVISVSEQGLPWLRICCCQHFSQMEKVGAIWN